MSGVPAQAIADRVLIGSIETRLARQGAPRRVVEVRRSPSAYTTSFALENLTAILDDGRSLELILKDVDPDRLSERTRRGKPAFLIDPRREVEVYRTLLMPRGLGAAVYGLGDSSRGEYWLLLEKVNGVELYQVGELDAWIAAAGWLAGFHQACRALASPVGALPLIQYTRGFYRLWLERARRFFTDDAPVSRCGRGELDWIAGRFDSVVDRLGRWPIAVIHGDFYASNVLAHSTGSSWKACPIDWEMAGAGPGILDLAALTSGNWSDQARRRIVEGYVLAGGATAALDETVEAVDAAQVYLAVQWLGWFGRRRPPAEHVQDWLADAVARARRLGL